jgi:hypothetical protein
MVGIKISQILPGLKNQDLPNVHSAYKKPPSFTNVWQKNKARETGYNLRNDDFFIIPLACIELFHKTPGYALPLACNTLPDHIRYKHNRCTFKIALTDYL